MTSNRGRYLLWLALLSGGLALAGSSAPCQAPDPRLEEVFSYWKARQEKCGSVRYRLDGEKLIARIPAMVKGRPTLIELAGDVKSRFERVLIWDIGGGRYRLTIDEKEYDEKTNQLYPRNETRTFDGTHVKMFRPRKKNTHPLTGLKPSEPEIGIARGWLGGAGIEQYHWPLFFGHGVVPTRSAPLKATNLKVLPDRELVVVHGQAVHRGRSCLVLRTQTNRTLQTFEEFWVDLPRAGAIVRYLYFVRSQVDSEFDIEYQKTSAGWLPEKWTYNYRDAATGKLVSSERVHVTEVAPDIPVQAADFDLEEKPGMKVQTDLYQAPKAGEAPETETKVFLIDDDGSRREVTGGTGGSGNYWWWLVLLVPAGSLLGWLTYRRRRPPGSAVPNKT